MTTMNNEDPADQSVHEPRPAPMPCPFCGHVGLAFGDGSTFRWLAYYCDGCGMGGETRMQTIGAGTREQWRAQAERDAVAAWNVRATEKVRPGAEAPRWWKCDTHCAARAGAWGCPECVRELRGENAALKRDLEYARGGLTKGRTRMREDNERLREALRKLVGVEDMRLRLRQLHEMGHGTDYADYHRLLPLAWAEAREALGPNVRAERGG